jgi:hypothetical protein
MNRDKWAIVDLLQSLHFKIIKTGSIGTQQVPQLFQLELGLM